MLLVPQHVVVVVIGVRFSYTLNNTEGNENTLIMVRLYGKKENRGKVA